MGRVVKWTPAWSSLKAIYQEWVLNEEKGEKIRNWMAWQNLNYYVGNIVMSSKAMPSILISKNKSESNGLHDLPNLDTFHAIILRNLTNRDQMWYKLISSKYTKSSTLRINQHHLWTNSIQLIELRGVTFKAKTARQWIKQTPSSTGITHSEVQIPNPTTFTRPITSSLSHRIDQSRSANRTMARGVNVQSKLNPKHLWCVRLKNPSPARSASFCAKSRTRVRTKPSNQTHPRLQIIAAKRLIVPGRSATWPDGGCVL